MPFQFSELKTEDWTAIWTLFNGAYLERTIKPKDAAVLMGK